ncbi:MAG: hypothetical protein ACXIUL_10610 [Wenzhouxiangella sp.]
MNPAEPGLKQRRQQILARIEERRAGWNAHAGRLTVTFHRWAGTPRSLLQAFLAGLVTDQLLATARYRLVVMQAYRPLARLMPLLVQLARR